MRPGLPVGTPPLLSGLRALAAAKVRARAGLREGARGGGRLLVDRDLTAGRGGRREAGPSGSGRRSPAPPPLSTARRLAPLYASARALWLLLALAALGLLAHFVPAALRAALLGRLRTVLPRA